MNETLEQRFVDAFRLAAIQAGALARRLQGKVLTESKDGDSAEAEALTAVDLAAQDVILYLLHQRLPRVAMDAEEATDSTGLFAHGEPARALVVVDPIDGTLNYIRGSHDFAVMGALLREGRYQAAVIHFPIYRNTLWGIRGHGCHEIRADGSRRRCRVNGAEDRIFYAPRTPAAWRECLARHSAVTELCRCSAVDSSAPASGRAKAAVARSRADRRRAIGLFLSLEAGATVRMGQRRWQGEDPEGLESDLRPTLVADSEATAEALMHALLEADAT